MTTDDRLARIEQRLDSIDHVLDRHLELMTAMSVTLARVDGSLEQIEQRLARIELRFHASEPAA
jgi:predicted  nucleic acid-binding Zn-ribbon protein